APGSPLEIPLRAEFAPCLFTEAGDALFLVAPGTGHVLDANPLAETLTRTPRGQLVGRPAGEVLRHEQGVAEWLEVVRDGGAFHGRGGFLLGTDRPDVWLPVSLSVSCLRPPGGTALALLSARDRS